MHLKASQKKVANKKIAHKKIKKVAPHKTAKRFINPSNMGINKYDKYDMQKVLQDEAHNLLFNEETGELAHKKTVADEEIEDMQNMTPEEFNQKFPTTQSLLDWESHISDLHDVTELAPTDIDTENKMHEFGPTETNHTGPASIQYNIFNEDTQFPVSKRLIGAPGTMEEPTMVFSPKPYRIIGCVGTVENPHPLAWSSMEGYLKHMCPTCGQIFQLTTDPTECDFSYVDKVDNMTHFAGAH